MCSRIESCCFSCAPHKLTKPSYIVHFNHVCRTRTEPPQVVDSSSNESGDESNDSFASKQKFVGVGDELRVGCKIVSGEPGAIIVWKREDNLPMPVDVQEKRTSQSVNDSRYLESSELIFQNIAQNATGAYLVRLVCDA